MVLQSSVVAWQPLIKKKKKLVVWCGRKSSLIRFQVAVLAFVWSWIRYLKSELYFYSLILHIFLDCCNIQVDFMWTWASLVTQYLSVVHVSEMTLAKVLKWIVKHLCHDLVYSRRFRLYLGVVNRFSFECRYKNY